MILSHQHRFVFIKGRKVAGTSIELALSPVCGPIDILTPLPPADECQREAGARNYAERPELESIYRRFVAAGADVPPPRSVFYNHMPLSEVERLADIDGYRVFVAERSPYAKVLSYLNMRQGGQGDPARFAEQFDKLPDPAVVRNIDLYRNRAGGLHFQVIRYEHLEGDLAALAAEMGLTLGPLPHAKRGLGPLDPLEYLRRDQIETINALYADDFEVFGFAKV